MRRVRRRRHAESADDVRPPRRSSVLTFMVTGFGACLIAVAVMVAVGAQQAFDRERERALRLLDVAATTAQTSVDPQMDGAVDTLLDLARSPDVTAMDPARCASAFGLLSSSVESVHVSLLDPEGQQVCTARAQSAAATPLVPGPWFARVVGPGAPFVDEVAHDPISAQPAVLAAVPVTTQDGRTGALAAVVYAGQPAPVVPSGLPTGTVLVVVDQDRRLVVSRSADAPIALGASTEGTPFSGAVPSAEPVVDVDGQRRYYVERPLEGIGWHVYAGLPESEALAAAWAELWRSAGIGGASLLLIALLGVRLHRRLAAPVRRLGDAIESSVHGQAGARATVEGPAEVARVAEVFNQLIVEREEREHDLEHWATHDALTGLPNRFGMQPVLRDVAARGGCVLYLDLDRFKLINDTHGHTVGDELLRVLAGRLVAAVGERAVIGRFGGDEFVAAAVGAWPEADAVQLAELMSDAVRQPVALEGVRLLVGGCVGVALSRGWRTPEDLVRDADTAMYHAKAKRVACAVFDAAMWVQASARLALESQLHDALLRRELSLAFQPVVSLDDRRVVGAEALLRWSRGSGQVSPADFIPVAEDSGLIVPIGRWVLENAVQQAARWQAAGRQLVMSVNVSVAELSTEDFVGGVARVLDGSGLRPSSLVLEVTESALLDRSLADSVLGELRSLGVSVAIDDFGTGYSSLSYLHQLPADELKIDQSFVGRLGTQPSAEAVVRTVLQLAADLDLVVVAEGVETPQQEAVLRRLGCGLGQGYLFGAAGSAEAFKLGPPRVPVQGRTDDPSGAPVQA